MSVNVRVRNLYTIQTFNTLTLQIKEQLGKTLDLPCFDLPCLIEVSPERPGKSAVDCSV